jgi:hypothetical protein
MPTPSTSSVVGVSAGGGIGIGRACCPIGTALVSEFAPRRIRATLIVMGRLQKWSEVREREQRTPPVSKESSPCFSLCYLLLKKLSKSMMTLMYFPFCAPISSLFFLENLPVSGKKQEAVANPIG